MILVLEQKETFPLRTRNKTDELVESFLEAAQDEQQQEQAVVLLQKLILVLEQKETCPLQTRNKTDELVVEFLEELGKDVHEMLCDNNSLGGDVDYCGLDSERDTEEEVEAIVRVFPEVLHIKGGRHHFYPIQYSTFLCKNAKTVSFIPILAKLAIEFGLFEEYLRGGLLCDDGT